MTKASKNIIFGSMGVAGLVALLAILDMAMGIPFAGQMVMDIMFLVGASLVLYMGYDAYQDLK